jgi:signal peptidase I
LKLFIIVSVASGLLIGFWIIGRLTYTLRLFRANPSAFFVISNLKRPSRFDLICYRAIVPPKGLTILTHRLCAMPGDTLEIKAGVLYVNGRVVDRPLPLRHVYKIQSADSANIGYAPQQAYIIPPYTNTLYVVLEDRRVKREQLPCQRYLLPPGLRDDAIFSTYRYNWNRDNFGPVKVPAGRWFVLDDDRSKTADSRYLGFIDPSAFVASVLWK